LVSVAAFYNTLCHWLFVATDERRNLQELPITRFGFTHDIGIMFGNIGVGNLGILDQF
jgi:hypothetical protein